MAQVLFYHPDREIDTMKMLIATTAWVWVFGQIVGDVPWLGSVSQLSATGLLFWMFWFLMCRQMPRERSEHHERMKELVDEQRDERRAFIVEISKLSAAIGRCRLRDDN